MLDENGFFGPHGIRALSRYHLDHPFVFGVGGQEYRVSYLPGDSDSGMGFGEHLTLFEVGQELAERIIGTFVRNRSERRPVFGGTEHFQTDPHWRDNILFYEYFHGDNGAGIGASHQTRWTGCIARIIEANGVFTSQMLGERDIERFGIRMGKGQTDSHER